MASAAEREPITRLWERNHQQGTDTEPWLGVRGEVPLSLMLLGAWINL